jgi:alkylation response protein AidB-like acyl-CoA dehydrogenase
MDFTLDETQLDLRKVARDFFADTSPLTAVRSLEDAGVGYDTGVWRTMASLGWTGLGHAEEHGGVGGGLLDLVMLYGEMGRNLYAGPHLESAVIAGGVLAAAGGHDELLAGILDGSAMVVPALMEPDGDYGPDGVNLPGPPLRGSKVLVPYVDSASHVLVAYRGADGVRLALVACASRSSRPARPVSRRHPPRTSPVSRCSRSALTTYRPPRSSAAGNCWSRSWAGRRCCGRRRSSAPPSVCSTCA